VIQHVSEQVVVDRRDTAVKFDGRILVFYLHWREWGTPLHLNVLSKKSIFAPRMKKQPPSIFSKNIWQEIEMVF